MPREDELWEEYEQKKAELEEMFSKRKATREVSEEEYHRAFKRLYKKYYDKASREVLKESRREIERIRKNNKLLQSKQGEFYKESKEK
ncbi:MAG: hypothetical protein ACMXYL_02670 [Candidatus Woesearchaeota archaeon]